MSICGNIVKHTKEFVVLKSNGEFITVYIPEKYKFWLQRGDYIKCTCDTVDDVLIMNSKPIIILNKLTCPHEVLTRAFIVAVGLDFAEAASMAGHYLIYLKRTFDLQDDQLFEFLCYKFDHCNDYESMLTETPKIIAAPGELSVIRKFWTKLVFVRRLVLMGMNDDEIFEMRNLGYTYTQIYRHIRKYPFRIWAFNLDKAFEVSKFIGLPEANDKAHIIVAENYRVLKQHPKSKVLIPPVFHDIYGSEVREDKTILLDYQILAEYLLTRFIAESKQRLQRPILQYEVSGHLDNSQISAVQTALNNKVSCITGRAGSGKTTVIKEIHKILKDTEIVYILAFTGKAVSRIKEMFSEKEQKFIMTLHKFFEKAIFPTTLTVIVDEMSMVDGILFTRLTQYLVGKNVRYILVGDSNQLCPIEYGRPFDLTIKECPVTKLAVNHRQKNNLQVVLEDILNDTFELRKYKYPEFICKFNFPGIASLKKIIKSIAKLGFYIICPYNEETHIINKYCDELFGNGERFYVGQRVMFTKNHEDNIFNNSQGTVCDVNNSRIIIDTVLGKIEVTRDENAEFSTKFVKSAWCITVHKSQGSEYTNCLFFLPRMASFVTKAMIYTAFSRAKKCLFFVSCVSEDKFQVALKRE